MQTDNGSKIKINEDLWFTSKSSLNEVNKKIDENGMGVCFYVSRTGKLLGVLTDGDIRRMLSNVQKPLAALMSDDVIVHAIKSPTTVTASTYLQDAIDIMGKNKFGICQWSIKASCKDCCIFIPPSMLLLERQNDNEYS